jgi:hypothetical protein
MPAGRLVLLFLLFVFAGGAGGLAGSIAGAFFGRYGLFAGGVVGGVLCAPAAAVLAYWLRWIRHDQVKGGAIGAVLGFGAAVLVAVSTLSTPVGPVLSTTLVGFGGVLGTLSPWKE